MSTETDTERAARWAGIAARWAHIPAIVSRWLGSDEPTPACPVCCKTFTVRERPLLHPSAHTRSIEIDEHSACGYRDEGKDSRHISASGIGHDNCAHCEADPPAPEEA